VVSAEDKWKNKKKELFPIYRPSTFSAFLIRQSPAGTRARREYSKNKKGWLSKRSNPA
jgi:hypothetical protein